MGEKVEPAQLGLWGLQVGGLQVLERSKFRKLQILWVVRLGSSKFIEGAPSRLGSSKFVGEALQILGVPKLGNSMFGGGSKFWGFPTVGAVWGGRGVPAHLPNAA